MKKNITIALLAAAVIAFALLYCWERLKREVTEEEYLKFSTIHLAAGAMEATRVRTGQLDSYFFLMECTFESFADLMEATDEKELNESLIENTKEIIAQYYVLSEFEPSPKLSEFLGEYLEREYDPFPPFENLPESRDEYLELLETHRKELKSNQSR